MKENKNYVFVLLGKPGSGKGIAAEIIKEVLWQNYSLSTLLVSTGDQYRLTFSNHNSTIKINNYNRKILKNRAKGKIQNPVASTAMWIAKIWTDWKGQDSIIMEGSPRTKLELLNLESFLRDSYKLTLVYLEIWVEDNLAIKNMTTRHNLYPRDETSTPERINLRLKEFYDKTAPVISKIARNNKYFYRLPNDKKIIDLKNKLNIILSNLFT